MTSMRSFDTERYGEPEFTAVGEDHTKATWDDGRWYIFRLDPVAIEDMTFRPMLVNLTNEARARFEEARSARWLAREREHG
jgi:hypothetical protein